MDTQKEKHQDILERAMSGEDRALWERIGEQARRQIRMKRVIAIGAAAVTLLLMLCAVAVLGLNRAAAGHEGWLARIFVPVMEARIYRMPDPENPPDFLPIKVEDGTWQMITDNTEAALMPYLPMDLGERYRFISGSIRQPDRDTFDMTLCYEVEGRAFGIVYQYRYGRLPDLDTKGSGEAEWGGTEVYLWDGPSPRAAWLEPDIYTLLSIEGDIDMGEIQEVFRGVKEQYIDEISGG